MIRFALIFVVLTAAIVLQEVYSFTIQSSITSRILSSTTLYATTANNNDELQSQLPSMGLNELQTQFRLAISREDMDAAALYSNELANRVSEGAYSNNSSEETEEELQRKRQRLSWVGLGTAPWLIQRLQALDYPLPTTIQINAFEAVNAILSDAESENQQQTAADDDTLEERIQSQQPQNMGVVISGSTGSGKTLAYLVPTLSTLSQTLFTRQRIRLKVEEDEYNMNDEMDDFIERILVQTSPSMRGQGYNQVGGKLTSLGKSGRNIKSPVALIVVPTRELGVQIALLIFELVGGNKKDTPQERSGKKNMFRYTGPKGVKIACILDDQMSKEGLKLQTDVLITTPQYLPKLIQEEDDFDPTKLRVVIYDEADLGLELTPSDALKTIFNDDSDREFSRLNYLVGATVTESLGNLAVKDEILPEGKSFIATATRFAPLTKKDVEKGVDEDGTGSAPEVGISSSFDASKATLKDLGLCLDPGLRHERVVVSDNTGLLCLTRMLRQELREFEIANATLAEENAAAVKEEDEINDLMEQLKVLRQDTKDLEEDFGIEDDLTFSASNTDSINTLQRPRVVVFFPDEEAAREAIFNLRDAMWGEHKIGVLLPDGENPLTIMELFKKGDLSVLLATPNSIRGLDFPALTHVYTLFLPANDPREYLHLAGRVGRIGQQGSVQGKGGQVTTILDEEEASQYDKMSKFLGFDYVDVAPLKTEMNVEESDVEDMRRYLEDTITLLGTVDEPEVKYASDVDDDDDDNEEEE